MARQTKRFPAWFLGLVIAVVVSLAALLVFTALGFGDDPVVDSIAVIVG